MKPALIEKADNAVKAFIGLICGNLHYNIYEVAVVKGGELPHWADYGEWANKAGVYVFLDSEQFLYVGRALKETGIGKRVWSHCYLSHYPGEEGWGGVIRNKDVSVRIYALDADEANYWVAGLELYLIDKLQPRDNVKTG